MGCGPFAVPIIRRWVSRAMLRGIGRLDLDFGHGHVELVGGSPLILRVSQATPEDTSRVSDRRTLTMHSEARGIWKACGACVRKNRRLLFASFPQKKRRETGYVCCEHCS
jgi:hypothetical protein